MAHFLLVDLEHNRFWNGILTRTFWKWHRVNTRIRRKRSIFWCIQREAARFLRCRCILMASNFWGGCNKLLPSNSQSFSNCAGIAWAWPFDFLIGILQFISFLDWFHQSVLRFTYSIHIWVLSCWKSDAQFICSQIVPMAKVRMK